MSMNYLVKKVIAIREGGQTQRAHTTPFHGSYNNAEHSWGVSTLLAILHPNPRMPLLVAGLWHDVHERWNGDPPTTSKWGENRRELREAYNTAKYEVNLGLDIDQFGCLTTEELRWLKACDMLELWLWSHDQISMGNILVLEIRSNVEKWMKENADVVPDQIKYFMGHYRYRCKRTSDIDGWKLKEHTE